MSAENNGGKTGYYDLPLPDREKLRELLLDFHNGQGLDSDISSCIEDIIALCPQTLNDIIEAKNMKPWQHEIFKATYALNERALKNPKKGSSKMREINKIRYYAERGAKLIEGEENGK